MPRLLTFILFLYLSDYVRSESRFCFSFTDNPSGNRNQFQHKRRVTPLHLDSFSGSRFMNRTGALRSKYFRHFQLTSSSCSSLYRHIPSSLRVQFHPNSDSLIDLTDTLSKLKTLARYMHSNPAVALTLTGNTGTDPGDKGAPFGDDEFVMNYPATLNGKPALTRDLMLARASMIRYLLVKHFRIQANRISIKPGRQSFGHQGRFVGVEIQTPD
ncbi:MAG: hypothetical protein ACHQRM_06375 [Bacteroidia bacterium]